MVVSPCLTPSLATDISPQFPHASLISDDTGFHHPAQYSDITSQSLKDRENNSNLRSSLVRADISGHRYSIQNTASHQVISVEVQSAPRPISLLDFPPELVTRILLSLSPLDIISCRRTCRRLYDLCNDSTFRYLIKMERSAVSDDMSPGLSYPERLRMLERREEAWATLNLHQSVNIPIPFNWPNHWSLAGGALLLGTALDCERSSKTAIGHSHITLPSLSDAQDQKFDWKNHNFEAEVMDLELAAHEHDMIAALVA